jgi:hypothetical protein
MPTQFTNNAPEIFKGHEYDQLLGTRKVSLQMWALNTFRQTPDGDYKYQCLKTFILLTWPEFVSKWTLAKNAGGLPSPVLTNKWNPWLDRNLRAICSTKTASVRGKNIFRNVVLTGAGGSGKTHFAGLYAVAWWMADIHNSIATLTSTTKDMIGQRIWPVVSHFWETAEHTGTGERFSETGQLGDKVDSSRIIRAAKGDDKHAITALAVAHGETQKAIHNLKGRHAPRMLLNVDEANGTPEAIFEIIPNMRKGCEDLTVLVIGNPGSRFDPHGRCLAPKNGWPSITEEVYTWETNAVPEWQLDPGIALRFDGWDSPNVRAGVTKWPYIYTCEDKANALHTPGYVGTFNYWVMERGLHPPEGATQTIFTEQLFARILDSEDVQFLFESDVMDIAFLDPAFTAGGDSCWFQTARMGKVGGKFCIQLTEGFEIPISPEVQAYDVDYQIARRVQQECVVRKIRPHCCGVDGSGGGRGVCAILAAEWSNQIIYTVWGGGASDNPSAQNDGRPAKDVFMNKVTELWWNVRECLEAGQIRGFTRDAMTQGCSRLYKMVGKRYQAEPKSDMKARIRYSPDIMDSIAGLVLVAQKNGLEISGKISEVAAKEWNRATAESKDLLGLDLEAEKMIASDGGWADSEDEMDAINYENTGFGW